MANEVLKTIRSRRSVRAYKRDVVPQELLREICEAEPMPRQAEDGNRRQLSPSQPKNIAMSLPALTRRLWVKTPTRTTALP